MDISSRCAFRKLHLDALISTVVQQQEYDRLKAILDQDKLKLPSTRDVQKKLEQYKELRNHVLTEVSQLISSFVKGVREVSVGGSERYGGAEV